MRIYIAGRYSSMYLFNVIAKELESNGTNIVCDCTWLTGKTVDTCPLECASNDIQDIVNSDLLLLFTDSIGRNGGCYVELGIAMSHGVNCIIVGPYTNVFTRRFRRVDSVKELLEERTIR
jgi:hypothetical protein